jgi:hypothetical protein
VRIFLDFDGVLRRVSSSKSKLDTDCIECFEGAVLSHPDAKVVIASTWRLVHKVDAIRSLFPPELAKRIEGVTPDMADAEEYRRHYEVQAYLNRNKLHGMRWVAVDDDPEQFRPGAPVIKVDPALGFNEDCGKQLRAWLSRK